MDRNRGFTFIEILVAVALVVVLAIPAYGVLRRLFCDGTALSDVVNVRIAMGGENPAITGSSLTVVGPAVVKRIPGARVSRGITMTFKKVTTKLPVQFMVTTKHIKGSRTYQLNPAGDITSF